MRIIHLDTVDSTNTYLKKLAFSSEASHGDVVYADRQSGGRGRLGRFFVSNDGIYCSVYLDVDQIRVPVSSLPLCVSVALARVLDQNGIPVKLKWVNDIIYHAKKLGGILCEAVTIDQIIRGIVVGFGLNISETVPSFPDEIRDIAIYEIRDKNAKTVLMHELIVEIRKIVSSDESWLSEYRELSTVLHQNVTVSEFHGDSFEAFVLDVTDDGGIILQRKNGEILKVISGEVSLKLNS